MRLRIGIVVAAVTFGCVTVPSVAEGATKSPPTRTVSASKVRTINGVTCAYLRKSGKPKGLRNEWLAGTRKGRKLFITHADTTAFYKAKGRKYRKQYLTSKKRATAAAKSCSRLTSIQFRTKGMIALGLSQNSTSAKTVKSSALKTQVIAGLYGISAAGTATGVISAIDNADALVVVSTKIIKTYQAPDSSIYIHYQSHPNSCQVGRVLASSGNEECLVLMADLPTGFLIGDAGGDSSETTDLIQFDHSGGVYINLSGAPSECRISSQTRHIDLILAIATDGTRTLMPHDSCRFTIRSWAPLHNGGILYSMGMSPQPGHEDGIARVLMWRNGITTLVKSGISLTTNGLQPMPGGKTLINVFASDPEVFSEQGGIFIHDDVTSSLSTWFQYEDQSPVFSHEDLDSIHCDCTTQLPLFSPLASVDGTLYGVGSLSDRNSLGGSKSYLWQLFPAVAPLVEVPWEPSGQNWSFSAATSKVLVLAGPQKTSWDTRGGSIVTVNLNTNTVSNRLRPSDGIEILTLTSSSDRSQVIVYAVRTADQKYLMGLFDSDSGTLNWNETNNINLRWAMPLSK